MSVRFIHLHVHSEYSLVDGCIRVDELPPAVAAAGMPAVAITDQSNLFAMVKFYRAAIAAGIKPIIGIDLWLANDGDPYRPQRLVLLCQNRQGYLNLTHLVSRSYIEGQHQGVPLVQLAWLQGRSDGLIALSGGVAGDIGQLLLAGNVAQAETHLQQWRALFPGRYYLELQRTGRPGEQQYLLGAVELARRFNMPVVATNDVRFLQADDFEAHEVRVCIHDGRTLDDSRRPRHYSAEQYLRTADEMVELFADIPEALANSVEIARRCNLELTLGKAVLPDFPVPDGMSVEDYFRTAARAGLDQRLPMLFDATAGDYADRVQPYRQRLDHELDVIINMGFPGYFLIVADFIGWARSNGVPVGPGRGSGAGSLVAYALKITDLDPIRYDLLFERFLNPERVSMPDFDIDFCMEGRDRVIDYVAQRYGRERVSQIITYGSMAAKAVIRDVGRVMGQPYGFVDRIAKLVPFELGITLDKALEQEEALAELYRQDEDVRTIIDMGRALEGLPRNAGKHAGGVVIAPTTLTDFTPLYCEQGSDHPVTQFDKDDVESVGLVKFDFLGLRTLTIIDWALRTINGQRIQQGVEPVVIERLPMDDAATYRLLQDCATTAVFQLESRGMKDLIKRLKPDCFEDIIALVALFRPGPLQSGMVDDFIARKHGARVSYPHADLEPVLKPTYGVILYQEQVMQIAQVLAGYTLGQADLLRRAMGKKKPEEMAKQREVFQGGAQQRGVDPRLASDIFDLMEKFAGYGFNKSHSAAYALLSYQTAWLKAHYPAAFMAAVLSSDMDNTDKVVMLIDECRVMGLKVCPPDINICDYAFSVRDERTILYGLGAIKGVGAAALEGMVSERAAHGPYQGLFDLCCRVDLRKVNRRVLEAMIRAGAFDGSEPSRARLMASLSSVLQRAERHISDTTIGQNDLFGGMAAGTAAAPLPVVLVEAEPWSDEERLNGEKETLGLYLTGHPIDRYLCELKQITSGRIAELKPSSREQAVTVAGLVTAVRTMNSKRGDRIAFVTLDDRSGRIEIGVFAEAYNHYRNLLVKDRLLIITGAVSLDDYSGALRMSADQITDIDQARELRAKRLELIIDTLHQDPGFYDALAQALQPFRDGRCPVWLKVANPDARASLALGREWSVKPADELLRRLSKIAGLGRVEVIY
ncbi:MAG: DNA polymerase III subunit alpha [Gammaproteobacteria bacterium]|nr:DNA polymerase III subunit alpha [Gammaproteobacteria bacterium]